jgi:hypothetical protein
MTLKRTPTLTPEESIVFKENVLRVLRKFGFRRDESGIRDYCLDTPAGKLHVSILSQTLSFDLQEKIDSPRTMVDRVHSSFSGKWDFLGPDILNMFEHDMERLICNPVPTPDLEPVWQNVA